MTEAKCSLCGEPIGEERAIVGEHGSICVDCVWMCVSILEERGVSRPEPGSDFDEDETSKVHDRSTLPPVK